MFWRPLCSTDHHRWDGKAGAVRNVVKKEPVLAGGFNRGRWRRWLFLSRLRSLSLGSGQWLGARCRLLSLLDQTAHRIGWLCAFADPILDAINVQRTIVTRFLWVVRANDLDKFPIARTALVGHHHFVVGAILRSLSA